MPEFEKDWTRWKWHCSPPVVIINAWFYKCHPLVQHNMSVCIVIRCYIRSEYLHSRGWTARCHLPTSTLVHMPMLIHPSYLFDRSQHMYISTTTLTTHTSTHHAHHKNQRQHQSPNDMIIFFLVVLGKEHRRKTCRRLYLFLFFFMNHGMGNLQ